MTCPKCSDCPFLDRDRAARLLGMRPKTLANWAHEGRGPAYRLLGGRCRYRLCWLMAFVSGQPKRP